MQVVCNEQHKYYLPKKEQLNKVDKDEVSMDIFCIEPMTKCVHSETNSKAPKTSNEYEIYKYVLPSAKIIKNYKNLPTTQEETNTSNKLFEKSSDEKVTLHFNTASWCNIDGAWPTIILNFSSKLDLILFFAFEDYANITDLIIETLEQLVVTGSEVLFWENTDNFMTDSVTGNLEVENYVAKKLRAYDIPHHLLCKTHVVEKLDETSLKVFSNIKI